MKSRLSKISMDAAVNLILAGVYLICSGVALKALSVLS